MARLRDFSVMMAASGASYTVLEQDEQTRIAIALFGNDVARTLHARTKSLYGPLSK